MGAARENSLATLVSVERVNPLRWDGCIYMMIKQTELSGKPAVSETMCEGFQILIQVAFSPEALSHIQVCRELFNLLGLFLECKWKFWPTSTVVM